MKSKFLNILKTRGFIQDCTDFVGLDNYFVECETNGKPAVAYIGFDCTATSLHAGSLMQIMILRHLQNCGHKPIALLGGGTTKIGDPSGKDETRKVLDEAAIEKNKQGIKKVFDKFLNNYQLVDNDEWLSKLNMFTYLRDIGRHFSVNRMLSMDSVKLRLEREQNLSFLEFNYMILQAYDFVELNKKYGCRLQIGGSDQWGNIVNGVELNRRIKFTEFQKNNPHAHHIEDKITNSNKFFKSETHSVNKNTLSSEVFDLFGLTTPLLTTASGAKMGKTADGAIWLDAELLKPYDYWQYWRNTNDADVEKFLKLFTELSLDEIKTAMSGNINEAKKLLANEATKLLHGAEAAKAAEETARKVFEQGGVGDDLPVFKVEKAALDAGLKITQLFTDSGFTASNGEAKKLIQGGGAKINDEKITDLNLIVMASHLKDGVIKLSAGKKKHALVKVK
jgi:tyrosyl-tRNA synthetase